MRIAFVTHSFPLPPEKDGHTLIAHYILKDLAQRHDIALFCFSEKPEEDMRKAREEFNISATIYPYPKRSLLIYYISSWAQKLAWFQYRLYTEDMRDTVERIDKEGYDLIVIHSPFVSAYLNHVKKTPIVFTYIDTLSNWYHEFFQITQNPLKKLHYLLEESKAKKLERQILPQLPVSIVVSNVDKSILSRICPQANIVMIPNGVNLEHFRPSSTEPDTKLIIFTGTMNYPPNIQAVLNFYEQVWPKLKKKHPKLRWEIVGKNPNLEVFELQSKDPDIKVTGFVKDLRPYLWRAAVYIAPLTIGTGFKNKIIEAMACGKAIVATDTSLSGLNVEAGRHVLKANTSDEFVAQISALLEQSTQRKEIERNARALAECFSWKETSQRYEEVYQKAAETTTALPHKLI